MPSVECLVFDMDDTLYPESEYVLPRIAAVAQHLLARFGPIIDFEKEMVAYYYGCNPAGRIFDTLLMRAGLPVDKGLIQELVTLYRSASASLHLYADVRPALEKWKRRLPLALVTDGYPLTQRKKVELLGLAEYFQEIVFTGEFGEGRAKPSPEPFRLVQRRIGFQGIAVYVGDNPALDIPGPRRLGWVTVRLVRPGGRFAEVPVEGDLRPDFVIRGLEELESIPMLARTALALGKENHRQTRKEPRDEKTPFDPGPAHG